MVIRWSLWRGTWYVVYSCKMMSFLSEVGTSNICNRSNSSPLPHVGLADCHLVVPALMSHKSSSCTLPYLTRPWSRAERREIGWRNPAPSLIIYEYLAIECRHTTQWGCLHENGSELSGCLEFRMGLGYICDLGVHNVEWKCCWRYRLC